MKKLFSAICILMLLLSLNPMVFAEEEDNSDSYLKVYFLDVGEGSCAVVDCDGYVMMIDGGSPAHSDKIYSFLKERELHRIDYLIASHPDTDHIGGLSGALNYATAGVVFCTVKENDSKAFLSLQKYIAEQNNHIVIPTAGDKFSLGSAQVEVLAPDRGVLCSDNTSIVLRLVYGETSFLFTGDAEKPDEVELLKKDFCLDSTVLCIGHHGSNSSTSDDFLNKVNPKYAIISVGNNPYGHPDDDVISRLSQANIETFRTDECGMIACICTNKGISDFEFEKAKEENALQIIATTNDELSDSEEITKDAETEPDIHIAKYVVNTSTGKFHIPTCKSVKKIVDSNRWDYEGTRQNLIEQGYSPCGNCHP